MCLYNLFLLPFLGIAFLILNLFFFLSSWAKSTTPPFSNLIHLRIGLSSVAGPLLDSIARETYKNLFGERLKALLAVGFSGLLAKVCLSKGFLLLYELFLLYVLVSSTLSFLSPGLLAFFCANNILLNLFILDNTLYLLLKTSSLAPGTVTCDFSNNNPFSLLFGSYILEKLLAIFLTSLYDILLYVWLLYLRPISSLREVFTFVFFIVLFGFAYV